MRFFHTSLFIVLMLAGSVASGQRISVITDTNGVLLAPTNLFQANSTLLESAFDTAIASASTNIIWPARGTNTTAETNGLVVTINADVSHGEVNTASNAAFVAAFSLSASSATNLTNYVNILSTAATNEAASSAQKATNALSTAAYHASTDYIGTNETRAGVRVSLTNGVNRFGGVDAGLIGDDEVYGGAWDGSTRLPTKNAVYDKIQNVILNANAGDVTGPASAVSGNLPSFIGTSGKAIQDSGIPASLGTNMTTVSSNALYAFILTLGGNGTNNDTVVSNALQAAKLALAGGTMTGPLTNYSGLYANGVGITNLLVVNIRDHGALGNGTANDSAAINRAINVASNYVATGSGRGAEIYIPNGNYFVSNTIFDPGNIEGSWAACVINISNITIRGESWGARVFTAAHTPACAIFWFGSYGTNSSTLFSANNATVKNLCVDGGRLSIAYSTNTDLAGSTLLDFGNSTNVMVDRCLLINSSEHMVDFEIKSLNWTVQNSIMTNSHTAAIHGDGIDPALIFNNYFAWCWNADVNFYLTNSGLENSVGAIDQVGSTYMRIIGNTFISNKVSLTLASGAIVIGNHFYGSQQCTNLIINGSGNSLIEGNMFNHTTDGISVVLMRSPYSGQLPNLHRFSNNRFRGEFLIAQATGVEIDGNTFSGNAYQIHFSGTSTNNSIRNNKFLKGNTLVFRGDGTSMVGNTIGGNLIDATVNSGRILQLFECGAVSNVFSGNTFLCSPTDDLYSQGNVGDYWGYNKFNGILYLAYCGNMNVEYNDGYQLKFEGNGYTGNAFRFNNFPGGAAAGSSTTDIANWIWRYNTPTNFVPATTRTNFIDGQLYTNNTGVDIIVSAKAVNVSAIVAGTTSLALEMYGNETNYSAVSTSISTLVGNETNTISGTVTNGGAWALTNKSTGAGNSAFPVGGQITRLQQ